MMLKVLFLFVFCSCFVHVASYEEMPVLIPIDHSNEGGEQITLDCFIDKEGSPYILVLPTTGKSEREMKEKFNVILYREIAKWLKCSIVVVPMRFENHQDYNGHKKYMEVEYLNRITVENLAKDLHHVAKMTHKRLNDGVAWGDRKIIYAGCSTEGILADLAARFSENGYALLLCTPLKVKGHFKDYYEAMFSVIEKVKPTCKETILYSLEMVSNMMGENFEQFKKDFRMSDSAFTNTQQRQHIFHWILAAYVNLVQYGKSNEDIKKSVCQPHESLLPYDAAVKIHILGNNLGEHSANYLANYTNYVTRRNEHQEFSIMKKERLKAFLDCRFHTLFKTTDNLPKIGDRNVVPIVFFKQRCSDLFQTVYFENIESVREKLERFNDRNSRKTNNIVRTTSHVIRNQSGPSYSSQGRH